MTEEFLLTMSGWGSEDRPLKSPQNRAGSEHFHVATQNAWLCGPVEAEVLPIQLHPGLRVSVCSWPALEPTVLLIRSY